MIRPFVEEGVSFNPEMLDAMSHAFTDVCNALRILSTDTHAREVIALRIIELARCGLTDPAALRDRVLMEARTAA